MLCKSPLFTTPSWFKSAIASKSKFERLLPATYAVRFVSAANIEAAPAARAPASPVGELARLKALFRRPATVPFPTDNRLRDDIGLPPLAEGWPPAPPQRLSAPTPTCFPSDDRLRDDIGLPPLGRDPGAAVERRDLARDSSSGR